MPIANISDAQEVEDCLARVLLADNIEQRIAAMRRLFVEALDYEPDDRLIPLDAGSGLPRDAYMVARRDGVSAVYVELSDDRVTNRDATAAARSLSEVLGDDLLLLFTNGPGDQFHVIHPSFSGSRPALSRMVVRHGEHHRTVVQQIANMWNDYGRMGKSIQEAIRQAFSVEPVTKAFFQAYRDIFQESESKITGFGSDTNGYEDRRRFTQTMFNRLMFVYFLSRKGWLSFGSDTDYLNALWRDYPGGPDDNFYNDRLALLFFAGLNNQQSLDLNRNNLTLRALIGDVPFLNGGLFEKNELDKRSDEFTVPDDAIEPILRDLFDQFNFTVMESTPYDTEVAVDPEMLGKVFEELVTGRNESGAYYTPRPVVSFMCREALKGYLEGQDTGLTAETISGFVDQQSAEDISVAAARRLANALEEVTVVDPACGSGAYLLGMMQELIELQTALYNAGVDSKAIYDLKLEIIQRNLYGVDIDEFAVNIAMLRLWLSLAIDYEGDTPEPLPNLEFKIVKGDSLLGPDPSASVEIQGTLGQDVDLMRRLGQSKADYMRAYVGSDKERLRSAIQNLRAQVETALGSVGAPTGVVDWRVEFAEVFAQRRGFDIALANPPYIQLQKDGGKLGNLYKNSGYETFVRTGDVYQLFYERGCQLLRSSYGLLAYITSNSWLRAEYGKRLRRLFSENHTPLSLLDLGKDVFDSAIVDSSVLLLRTGSANGAFRAVDMDGVPNGDFPPDESLWGWVRPSGETPWSILSPPEQRVMDKMLAKGTPLKEWDVFIYRGVTTGYNQAFIIDEVTKDGLVAKDSRSYEVIKPILRGRDIQRFTAPRAGRWLVATFPSLGMNIEDYPAIKEHLLSFGKDRLEQSGKQLADGGRSRKRTRHSWFELQDATAYYREFAKEKLFWMDLTDQGRFAYDDGETFCGDTGFMMIGESLKYLCATLNSSVMTWFMQSASLTSGMGTTRWKKFAVERLPIPRISPAEQRPFIRLVDEIIETKTTDPDADTSYLEWEIDRLVYDLYGLTDEEDTAIERSLGLIHATDEE